MSLYFVYAPEVCSTFHRHCSSLEMFVFISMKLTFNNKTLKKEHGNLLRFLRMAQGKYNLK